MFKMASHRGLNVNQPMGPVKATAIPMAPRHILFQRNLQGGVESAYHRSGRILLS